MEYEKLGAKFSDFLQKNEINDIKLITSNKIKSILYSSFIHGAELKSYEFNLYKTNKIKKNINLIVDKSILSSQSKKLDAILKGVNFTRDLVSEPGNILHPDEYAKRLNSLKKDGLKINIYENVVTDKRFIMNTTNFNLEFWSDS